jgi:hypothetical protein
MRNAGSWGFKVPTETVVVVFAVLCLLAANLLLATGCSTSNYQSPPGHHEALGTSSIHSDYQVTKAKNHYRALHPRCAVCGAKSCISNGNRNDVHHKLPVSYRPDLAATPSNLITLCRRHHFWIGHAGSWRSYNTNLVNSIEAFNEAAKQIQRN